MLSTGSGVLRGSMQRDHAAPGFFGNPGGGFSWPAFQAGESLAGNDSWEASSTGSSAATGDRNSGLRSLLDACLGRGFRMCCPDCILAVPGETVNCAIAGGRAKNRLGDRS